ncbi:MAG TPA: hypothetical protein VF329_13310 [Gammaproteobacteria bacterium]
MDSKKPGSENRVYDELPEIVRAALRRADRTVSHVSPAIDRAVIERAERYFAARGHGDAAEGAGSPAFGRSSLAKHRWAAGLAAAAAVAAVLLVVRPGDWLETYDSYDVDRSGRVDILDAFALARMRAAGGTVSEAEIDALAARVVSLDSPRSTR